MEYKSVYENGLYAKVMGTGIIGKVWVFIHRSIEKPFKDREYSRILEVGAGEGQHFDFVGSKFEFYFETDLRMSRESIGNRIRESQDVCALSYEDNVFERVIVTCVLPHVNDLPKAISEIKRVSRTGSDITIYLPCEPGLLLRFLRKFTTSRKFIKHGYESPYLAHYLEHKYYFSAMNHLIKEVFSSSKVTRKFYPFAIHSWNLNLFVIVNIKV